VSTVSLGRLFVSGRDPAMPVALRDTGPIMFGQFAADVAGLAAAARDAGVGRGAVLSADPYRFLVGLFGLLHAGAAVVLPPDGMAETLASLRDRFDMVVTDEPPAVAAPRLPIETAPGGAASLPALDPAAASLEFFTSGSTGVPKRIPKPLLMLDQEIATLDAMWGAAAGQGPVLSTVPHRHIFGLTFHVLWPLASGRPFVSVIDLLLEPILARDVAGATLVTSPAHLTRLAGLPPLPAGQQPRRVFTAGAPLRASQAIEAAAVLGVAPTEIFGSTETGAIATRMQRTAQEPWTPLIGNRVTTDPEGCMVVHAPYGPTGGPFTSADRVELLPDGRFHFLGRADRVAKIEGKRVSLPRLEEALADLPEVRDAAAVVLDGNPERLAAAVVLTEAGQARLAALGPFRFSRELRRALGRMFESAWLPKSWRFVADLPNGAMGKRRDADVRLLFLRSQP
jgi:acyl-coenzyme A synthetase/AMP-(fatty) acid ligase